MNLEKFNDFCAKVEEAFQRIALQMAGLQLEPVAEPAPEADGMKAAVIVGMSGLNKGRVVLEVDEQLAQHIAETMNGEKPETRLDTYQTLAEFANIFNGHGITAINNAYRDCQLRLTPPAVFGGGGLEITSPNIQSTIKFFRTPDGIVKLDIGFEGV